MTMTDANEEKKEPNSCINNDTSGMFTNKHQNAVEVESEMRGVHARSNLPPNTVCMTIPLRCLITVEMGQATEIGQAILHSDLDLDAPKHIYLMIYILWDLKVNGASSFFDPYYQILPLTLHNMPIFWKEQELLELTGSYLLQQIHDRNQAIAEDYQAICAIAPQMSNIATLQEFKWARMCVCSRNFGLCINGHRTSALVPHADMLNHYRPRETKWTYDETLQAFTITTLQYIHAGSEVLDSYGQKCNHRFLLNYGFAIEDNREIDGFCPNEVPIELFVSPHDPIFDEKIDFWIKGGTVLCNVTTASTNPFVHSSTTSSPSTSNTTNLSSREQIANSTLKRIRICVTNNENTRLLLSLLRILACSPDEFHNIILGGGAIGSSNASQQHQLSSSAIINANTVFDSVGYTSPKPQRDSVRSSSSADAITGLPYPTAFNSLQHQHTSSATINNIHRDNFTIIPYSTAALSSPAAITSRCHRSFRDIRHPINLRNERESMKILRKILQELLSQYPTTLQQDIEALKQYNIIEYPKFSNHRHAKIQVKGEKMVIHHYLKWSQTAIDVINVIESELLEEVQQYNLKNTAFPSSISSPGFEALWQDRNNINVTAIEQVTSTAAAKVSEITRHYAHQQSTTFASSTSTEQISERFVTSFDMIIRRMEEDMNSNDNENEEDNHDVHHSILRYCVDMLGHLRQEEFRHVRKQLQQQQKGSNNNQNPSAKSRQRNNNGSNTGNQNGSEYV
jgi:SET domain/Rubisco LSMT substrate-binding